MFSVDFIHGSSSSLNEKYSIVISDDFAKTLFGNNQVVGQSVEQVLHDAFKVFEIVGVYESPPWNSSFEFDACINYVNMWDEVPQYRGGLDWKGQSVLFVKLIESVEKESAEVLLKKYADLNNRARNDFYIGRFDLQPFNGMAIADHANSVEPVFIRPSPPIALFVGTFVISLALLVVVSVNCANDLATRLTYRLKEIGIRRALGCGNIGIARLYAPEVLVLVFLSTVAGILVTWMVILPFFNDMWQYKIVVDWSIEFLFCMIGIFLSVLTLIAFYPTFYILRTPVVNAPIGIRSKVEGKIGRFQAVVIFFQLGVALVAVATGASMIDNAKFQQEVDLGFDSENGIYAWVDSFDEYAAYKNLLTGNKDVMSVTFSKDHLFVSHYEDPVQYGESEFHVSIMEIGDNYLNTVGFKLAEGRDFRIGSESDKREAVIISENFAAIFGITDPVGKQVKWLDSLTFNVIGVIKDVYTNGLWAAKEPLMLRYSDARDYPFVIVRARPGRVNEVNRDMQMKWRELFPNRFYPGTLTSKHTYGAKTINANLMSMTFFLATITLVLSLSGLSSSITREIQMKGKDIGIRKACGASYKDILVYIGRPYMCLVLKAVIVGSFLVIHLAEQLMRSFWYFYSPLNPYTLAAACVFFIMLTFVVIAVRINRAASINPVEALRQ